MPGQSQTPILYLPSPTKESLAVSVSQNSWVHVLNFTVLVRGCVKRVYVCLSRWGGQHRYRVVLAPWGWSPALSFMRLSLQASASWSSSLIPLPPPQRRILKFQRRCDLIHVCLFAKKYRSCNLSSWCGTQSFNNSKKITVYLNYWSVLFAFGQVTPNKHAYSDFDSCVLIQVH